MIRPFRSIFIFAFLGTHLHALAQEKISLSDPWNGKRFDTETNVSPIDSLSMALSFDWHKANGAEKSVLLNQLVKLYPDKLTIEWVSMPQMTLERYIINDGSMTILEKQYRGDCIIFYINKVFTYKCTFKILI